MANNTNLLDNLSKGEDCIQPIKDFTNTAPINNKSIKGKLECKCNSPMYIKLIFGKGKELYPSVICNLTP